MCCSCAAVIFSVVFSTPIQSLLYAHVNVADMYCQHTIESTEEEIHKKFLRQIHFSFFKKNVFQVEEVLLSFPNH